ncbi:uncharacterized protein LOC114892301 [Monodon monoceros]|uniref:uncharacterized protein LOC114892301 n=1 Tax=Monodon monoceros TaxID=40151 RepID=UPI0010F5A9F9|nr:uncharacterized protein LOC114892301 [Monodon monoceros]
MKKIKPLVQPCGCSRLRTVVPTSRPWPGLVSMALGPWRCLRLVESPRREVRVGWDSELSPWVAASLSPDRPEMPKQNRSPPCQGGGRRYTHPCGQPLCTGQVGAAALPRSGSCRSRGQDGGGSLPPHPGLAGSLQELVPLCGSRLPAPGPVLGAPQGLEHLYPHSGPDERQLGLSDQNTFRVASWPHAHRGSTGAPSERGHRRGAQEGDRRKTQASRPQLPSPTNVLFSQIQEVAKGQKSLHLDGQGRKETRHESTRTAHTTHTEIMETRTNVLAPRPASPRPHQPQTFQFQHSHTRYTGFSLNKKQVPLNKEYSSETMGKALSLLRQPRQGSGPREAFGQEGLLGPGGWAPSPQSGRGGGCPGTFSLQTQAQPQGAGRKINSCWFWFKKQFKKKKGTDQ